VYWKFGLVNSTVQWICKNRIKVISAFGRNGSRIERFRKPKCSEVDEALLQWYQQDGSDSVPVSCSLLMVTFFLPKF
jgi:hypothetical protein